MEQKTTQAGSRVELNIDIDYKVELPVKMAHTEKGGGVPSYPEMTDNFIRHSVMFSFKTLNGQKRRIWARIQRKLQEALKGDNFVINLEREEVEFLKDSMARSECPPEVSMYYTILEDIINSL